MRENCAILAIISIISSTYYGCEKTNETPTCAITNPVNGEVIAQGETINISVEAVDKDGIISEVRFYIDDKGVYSSKRYPFNYEWNTTGKNTDIHTLKATAIDDEGSLGSSEVDIYLSGGGETGEVTDYAGNTYKTVKIGNQWWMAENLKAEYYPDGTEITLIESQVAWDTLDYDDKAFCYYNYNANDESETYGALYTWTAATNGEISNNNIPIGLQGVCPDGWHLPTDQEWKQLEMNLGMDQYEVNGIRWRGTDKGAKLKDIDLERWNCPNTVATNETGFSALPGGLCYSSGFFESLGSRTFFWTSSKKNISGWYRCIHCQIEAIYRDWDYKNHGFSGLSPY